MQLSLTNISSLKAYFYQIATTHRDIDQMVFGEEEVIRTTNRTAAKPRQLWVEEYEEFDFMDELADNVLLKKTFRITYMKVPASQKFDDIQSGKDDCEKVIKDIIAKLMVDKAAGLLVTTIASWKGKVGLWDIGGTRYCGCQLSIEIMDNTWLVYDPSTFDKTFDSSFK